MIMDGVFGKWTSTLKKICAGPGLASAYSDRLLEFGIRWDDGEIAEDVLVLDTNGFSDAPIDWQENGQTYTLSFTEKHLKDVFALQAAQPEDIRPPITVALRFFLEFDAFLTVDSIDQAKPRNASRRSARAFQQIWWPELDQTPAAKQA